METCFPNVPVTRLASCPDKIAVAWLLGSCWSGVRIGTVLWLFLASQGVFLARTQDMQREGEGCLLGPRVYAARGP